MFSTFLSLALGFAIASAPARAVLTITYPTANTPWFENNTVSINWTSSTPSTDNFLFHALLSNQDQSVLQGNNSIADSINATADYVSILLPKLTPASNYIINLVNTTNQAQIFATSQPFQIEAGTVANTTSSASSGTSGAPSTSADIPNYSAPASNPFAASTTSSASSVTSIASTTSTASTTSATKTGGAAPAYANNYLIGMGVTVLGLLLAVL